MMLIYLLIPFAIHLYQIVTLLVRFGKVTENGTKKPSAKPRNRLPRVKVLNYLKKVALFFRFERDVLADGAGIGPFS